jgi:hypothetical protein
MNGVQPMSYAKPVIALAMLEVRPRVRVPPGKVHLAGPSSNRPLSYRNQLTRTSFIGMYMPAADCAERTARVSGARAPLLDCLQQQLHSMHRAGFLHLVSEKKSRIVVSVHGPGHGPCQQLQQLDSCQAEAVHVPHKSWRLI